MLLSVSYGFVFSVTKNQTLENFKVIASKTVTQFEKILYDMDNTCLQIASNPSVVRVFQSIPEYSDGNYFTEEPSLRAVIKQLLASYSLKQPGFIRICLYNDTEDLVYTATTFTVTERELFNSPDFEYIKKTFTGGDYFSCFLPPKPDIMNGNRSPYYFSVVREIKDYSSNSQPCGYVEVQNNAETLTKLFTDLPSGISSLVINSDNKIICSAGDFFSNSRVTAEVLNHSRTEGEVFTYRDAQNHYCISFESKEGDFTLLFQQAEDTFLMPFKTFNMIMCLSFIALIVISICAEHILSSKLTEPLYELQEQIEKVSIENLKINIDDNKELGIDIIQQLNSDFHKMFFLLNDSFEKKIAAETNELRSLVYVLQSQMHPHFFHNILSIIAMDAELNQTEQIQMICHCLSKMLAFTSSMGNGCCTVQEEVEYAEQYLKLMKIRHENIFEYSVELAESMANVQIPKLIIQPLCENCFSYGFKNKKEQWNISIKVYFQDDYWFCDVTDNGSGFSEEILHEIDTFKKTISMDNVTEYVSMTKIGGLSLKNILMRLLLRYSSDYIFEIKNNDQGGASVILGGKLHD